MNDGTVNVLTSATSIKSSNSNRISIQIRNDGSNTVYIGDDVSVTTSNGYPIRAGETLEIGDYYGAIYGIADTSTTAVSYMETEAS